MREVVLGRRTSNYFSAISCETETCFAYVTLAHLEGRY